MCLLVNLSTSNERKKVKKIKTLKKYLTNEKRRNIIKKKICKSYDEDGQEKDYSRELMFGANQYNYS